MGVANETSEFAVTMTDSEAQVSGAATRRGCSREKQALCVQKHPNLSMREISTTYMPCPACVNEPGTAQID
jgi:hypothetical protein